jgi:hypothetical protein
MHTPERQSPFAPHPLPSGHEGAHAGGLQIPPVHTPEAQSPGAPHAPRSSHVGEHAGG